MKPHAFVAMPFGVKPGPDQQPIDFNRVFAEYIAPALEAAGLEVLRADQEVRAGDIRADMFQELLMADLVVADISINNPNVWYELGVRHALRARGVVLVCGAPVSAFDLYTDRKLHYHLKAGAPDPATLAADRAALTTMVQATMESWHGRMLSPVYQLLPNLREPDWTSLRIGQVREFWEAHDDWERRIELAGKAGHIGDILVLADEAPVAAFRAQAWISAGECLRKAGRYDFALEQLERGLDIQPLNLEGLREQGICLQRLGRAKAPGHSSERARAHYLTVLQTYERDSETWALLGRVDKDDWVNSWRVPGRSAADMRAEAAYEDALLRTAIESYRKAYRANVGHYFSGINALTLIHLLRDLTGDDRYDAELNSMLGAVRFAAMNETDPHKAFWAAATIADLEVLSGTPESVTAAFKEAVARDNRDWFALDSCREQLRMLADLAFRLDAVNAGIAVLEKAMEKAKRPADRWQPRRVLLFSGHMIDAPDRVSPRFPASMEPAVAARLAETLDKLGVGAEDLALSQAAAGGDLLFLEACRARGVRCQMLLPFAQAPFVEASVEPSQDGERWRERFFQMLTYGSLRVMPEELGPGPKSVNPFERCNLWLLDSALALGVDKVHFVCVWNGGGGDGPGGTAHMYNEVKRRTGRVTWIDTREL